jgi:molybdate transport system substrate-binding protein
MPYQLAPIHCRPWLLLGLSPKLIESHYENNYGGAMRRLNGITAQLESLDYAGTPGYVVNSLKREQLVALNSTLLHELYFASLGGAQAGTARPAGAFAEAISRDFGSFAGLQDRDRLARGRLRRALHERRPLGVESAGRCDQAARSRMIPTRRNQMKILLSSSAVLAALSGPAGADEIRLLSAAAMQSVFKEVASEFERTSGHKLAISYGTIGGVNERVLKGEAADVVIGSTLIMPGLVRAGRIRADSLVTVCRTGIGLVVQAGAPKPPMSSVEDFKQAVLAARVLVYADPVRGGAAGVHIGRVLQDLGLADRLKSSIKLGAGGDVTEVTLAQGEGALGITQISEIVGKPAAQYVGPMPAELQNATVFVAGIPADAKAPHAAMVLVAFLKSPAAVTAIRAKGMQVP